MKVNEPALRRQRDAKHAPDAPTDETQKKDKPTKIVEQAVKEETPLPEMEKGRPKDSGRMGA